MFFRLQKLDWTTCLLICGLALLLFGTHALVAWHGGQSLLPDFLWTTYLIQYDSAWAFALCGLALIAFSERAPIVVALCAGATMIIGLVRLLGYFIPGLSISVNPILVHPWLLPGAYDDLSPPVALAFVISGYLIGALKHPPYTVVRSIILEALGLFLVVLALFFIVGSYNESPIGYEWFYFDDLDALNAAGFFVLGISVLCFVFFGSDQEAFYARRWAPAGVWLAVFVGSLGLWQGLLVEEARQIRIGTSAVLDAVGKELTNEMNLRVGVLERFAARWDASSAHQIRWQQEAQQLLRDIPEFREVGWADADMTIQWIVPGGPVGGSLLRDQVRANAAKAARAGRSPVLTKSVELQIGGREFQAYVPVYSMDEFRGLVVGTFVNEGWVESLLGERFPRHTITVFEGDKALFHAHLKEQGAGDGWASEKPLVLYNNEWRLRVAPTRATLNAASSVLPEAVLAGGILLGTLLAAAVFLYQVARRRAKSLSAANNLLAMDIEVRKQTEQALRESEHKNRIIINGVADHAIFMLDRDGKISSWNKGAEQLTGYRATEAIGRDLSLLYPADASPTSEKLAAATSKGWFEEECWHERKDKARFCGDDVISPIRDEKGDVEGYAVITRDQTERIELRKETEQARDYYLRLFSSFPNMVWRTDASGQCDYCNPAWLQYTGRSHEQEMGTGWMDGLHPDDRAAWTGAFEQSLKKREPFEIQYRLRRVDGQYGWIICSCKPYYNLQGELAGYLASCYDNTIRRRMEAEIENSRERILAFSRHLQVAREEEKVRLARELHDELGATLTALRLEVSALMKKAAAHHDVAVDNYGDAIRLADSAIQSTRKIITDLRPSILDNLGLLAALQWYAGDFSKRSGIKAEVLADDGEIVVDEENALVFFRIAQEALTNVIKHAKASMVTIRFTRSGANDILEITDNGIGMAEGESLSPLSNGILGMRERARELHGDFSIVSMPGSGTTVAVTLPAKNSTPS